MVRHFTRLSQMNFAVDTNFYPLGSCTMKYNPKINDVVASQAGFSGIHPLQPEETVQGSLELMHRLQEDLQAVTGMPASSLAPLAGAHGELAGVLMDQGVPRGARGAGPQGHAHPGQRPRHQPGIGGDGRVRGGLGAVGRDGARGTWRRWRRPATTGSRG